MYDVQDLVDVLDLENAKDITVMEVSEEYVGQTLNYRTHVEICSLLTLGWMIIHISIVNVHFIFLIEFHVLFPYLIKYYNIMSIIILFVF